MRCLFALILPVALMAQNAGTSPTLDPAKREAIVRLLKVTKSGDLAVQAALQGIQAQKQAMPQVPEIFWAEFTKEMNAEAFETLAIPIYDKHFSLGDLKAILAFYETPAGRLLLAKQPMVLQESMEAGQALGAKLGQEVALRLKAQGKL